MPTPIELKETLIKQYNESIENLRRLEGALAACDELLKKEEETDD
jgi:hypothetical protein